MALGCNCVGGRSNMELRVLLVVDRRHLEDQPAYRAKKKRKLKMYKPFFD